MSEFWVTFKPDDVRIQVSAETTVMAAAREAGVELEGPCGGNGTCGKCRVMLVSESGSERERWALACQTPIRQDLVVNVPQAEVSLARKSAVSQGGKFKGDPGIRKAYLAVESPSLTYQVGDAERLLAALVSESNGPDPIEFKLEALRALPRVLSSTRHVTAVLSGREVLAVEPGDTRGRLYGMGIDIGTTTVVASLVDLLSGEILGTASATNSQNIFGADVIARIEHASKSEETLGQLRQRVVAVLNRLIRKLSQTAGIQPNEVYQAAVAGNTAMNHLFLGLNPANLAPAPYIPVTTRSLRLEARDLGLMIAPHAPVYTLPNIAGYVGGDTMAVILATELEKKDGVLVFDIGTNGEIILASKGQLYACSTAAGPAFEGAAIRQGMRAATGAIEGVSIDQRVQLKVIDGAVPKGICGSGLLEAVAELLRVGVIDANGRMLGRDEAGHLSQALKERLGRDEQGNYFALALPQEDGGDGVLLTQRDVRELQLAKAAMRVGAEILLKEAGLTVPELDKVLLAGAFGSYINIESALALGLLPLIAKEQVESVGNAAGIGAMMAVASEEVRQKATGLAVRVKHIELSGRLDFQEQFIDTLGFPI